MVDFDREIERIRQERGDALSELERDHQRSLEKRKRFERAMSWTWLCIALLGCFNFVLDIARGSHVVKCVADAACTVSYFALF